MAAAAVVWVATGGLRWPARVAVVFLLTVLPAFLAAQERQSSTEVPTEIPRPAIYASSAVALWVLAAMVMLAGLTSGFTPPMLGFRPVRPVPLLGWTVGVTVLGLGLLVLTRALRVKESPTLVHVLPRSGAERFAFVGLAVTAGAAEELIFRGFLIPALTVATGSVWFAALLSSALFGFLHSYQRLMGTVRAGVLGFVLALPLMATGSLLPSILAHAAYDIVAGVFLARWVLRTDEEGEGTPADEAGNWL